MAAYDLGPSDQVRITLSGEALEAYGPFENLPQNVQEALQITCQAVCQTQDILERGDSGFYDLGGIFVTKILNKYLFTDEEMMTIINVEKLPHSYDIDFFSVNRLPKIQVLVDLADERATKDGKCDEMFVPGLVLMYRPAQPQEMEYFRFINAAILDYVTSRGVETKTERGDEFVFKNRSVKLRYFKSFYENNSYQVKVHRSAWDDVPPNARHLITEGGWNFVYHFQDSPDRKIVHCHVPGSWIDMFKQSYGAPVDTTSLLEEEKGTMNYSVNIGGNATNVQIQNNSSNSSQVLGADLDFEKCQRVLDQINKYRPQFEGEFGEKRAELSAALDDAQAAVNSRNVSGWQKALNAIRDLCIGATGSLIASGILAML